ncbi:uncharacterized protein LOC110771774 [Prunus avium]|uniref:Protein FAR1-RELATED SEQUENCE n=1 Tax=Prunus avium TaxID=42229 RepID=A0A6P5TYE0_PRUAV|nr:uncharacterized protein LOC110771774 [Prunus avium]
MKELVHDKDADKAYCSCKGFEFWGIPCRHILAFLRMKQVEHLLDNYIVKRWLQSVKCGVVYDKNDKEVKDCVDGLVLVKRSKLGKVAVRMKDPHRVKAKGHARRVKGQKEKAAEGHKRRCSECRKTDHDRRSSSSDAEVGAAVDENSQPSQSTQDREPTMT